ncbi:MULTISPECIES: enoyl-CoA hydratase/isomerase family protein [unclassified Streptomyces]|uniref:enoyl-CoA hydratase/isomerase family protein n=1 Tax=unclassified Streptomyces TaxID=2593676 RepID=UPI001656206A|nr:enoyl-CoA hydratase-related protein [Streptomyces sp. CB02980]MCB8901854.1 enoyl-CoA hydratase/isomerase family protein [Streptomyces sp. CB02980]
MNASEPSLLVTRPLPGVVAAALNRPARRNALNEDLFARLTDLCAGLRADPSVRVLVLTGAGDTFCAGYDIDEVGRIAALPPLDLLDLLHRQAEAITGLTALPQTVIAAVDGSAVGAGLSLALAADIRLAAPGARFRASFVKMGLSGGDMGASWLLPRLTSLGFASDMMLTGRFVAADEALARGLVSRVTAPGELAAAALRCAAEIAANSPVSLALTKQVLQANTGAPSLAAALEREAPVQVVAAHSPDVREAVAAFRARRAPDFAAARPTDPQHAGDAVPSANPS